MEDNNKQKNILTIIGFLIILTVFYNSFYTPRARLIKQKEQSLATMKQSLASSEQKVNSLTGIRNSCMTYAEKIRLIKDVIPKDPAQFEKNIVEFAELSSLNMKSLNPKQVNTEKNLSTRSLNLKMTGTFEQFYDFISKLENTYKTAYISGLSMNTGNDNTLNLVCTVSFSYLTDNGAEK